MPKKSKTNNRILTLDDLYTFYLNQNKTCTFSSKKSGYKISVQVPAKFEVDNETDDDTLLFCNVKLIHSGENRNHSCVTDEALHKAGKSLAYKPILANFMEYTDEATGETLKDFTSHDMIINDDGTITYLEKQIGCFTADEPYYEVEEETGHNFLFGKCAIPREYTDACSIIERKNGTKVSAELEINEMKYNAKSKVLELTDVIIQGATCLGKDPDTLEDIGEGMLNARLDIADFSTENNSVKFNKDEKIIELLEKLNNTLSDFNTYNSKKGGENQEMTKFEELLKKYNKTIEDITFDYKDLSDDELTAEVVDARMREDKEAGLREYGNIFTSEGGDGQIIRRADIIRNSVPRVPDLKNKDGQSKYVLMYDPARLADRAVILVAEVYYDDNFGWKARIVNVISLVDMLTKKKTPMSTPNQIKALKQIILEYNGDGNADYENILAILVDSGSGGAGVPITDFLCEDWEDENGIVHRGLIDSEFRPDEKMKSKFPNAIDGILHLISPAKYKSDLFEALIKMMQQNLIEFTEEYMNKGYLNLIYEKHPNGKLIQRYTYPSEKEEKELRKKDITIEIKIRHLELDEEVALKQIDSMKNELVNIYRYKQSNGKDRFDLASDKAGKLNDDKAYCAALLGWQLSNMRRENILNKKKRFY